jgi:hypothetical protein
MGKDTVPPPHCLSFFSVNKSAFIFIRTLYIFLKLLFHNAYTKIPRVSSVNYAPVEGPFKNVTLVNKIDIMPEYISRPDITVTFIEVVDLFKQSPLLQRGVTVLPPGQVV